MTRQPKEIADWEQLGAVEPYFAVLTEPRYLKASLSEEDLRAFHESGERDVRGFLESAGGLLGPVTITNALEFGCGVGRLTLPLARVATHVVGVDASPSLLAMARERAAATGASNVEFLDVGQLDTLAGRRFDFLLSYIVFQHIPTADGERYLARLLALADAEATAVLHFTLSRPGGRVLRALRSLRAKSRLLHRIVSLLRRESPLPYMQMNPYDRSRIEAILASHGFRAAGLLPTNHGGVEGAIFIARKTRA